MPTSKGLIWLLRRLAVHDCIDVVFDLFNKYGQLIRGGSTANDVVMTPWVVVFRTQWIPDDQWRDVANKLDRVTSGTTATRFFSPARAERRHVGGDVARHVELHPPRLADKARWIKNQP